MSVMKELFYPFSEAAVKALRAGDTVRISGLVYTGRDRLHKHLAEGGKCPVQLRDGAIFHCGPVTVRDGDGWRVAAAGPTTSIREEPYMASIIGKYGVRVVIGKGGMGKRTLDACRELGCVYLQAVGGAAALLAKRIRRVDGVDFLDEFGATEALWHLTLEGLETVVGMDAHGNSVYEEVRRDSEQRLRELIG